MRLYAFFLFLFISLVLDAQVTSPYTKEILPFDEVGDYQLSHGNFSNYPAQYGLINHLGKLNALPFVLIQKDTLNPWLMILNGGPGRTNLRLSFELDSLLPRYNIFIPGYRGIDDKTFEGYENLSIDSLKQFITYHKKLFGSQNVCEDIHLICKQLNIDSLSILGHSFGTLISAEFTQMYPKMVDTIFAFSPVSYKKPYPSAEKMRVIIDKLSRQMGYNPGLVIKKLSDLTDNTTSQLFYMGVISSFYTKKDIEYFIKEILADKLSVNILEKRGERFVSKEWLFDFGLKFCKVDSLYYPSSDVFSIISLGFKDCIDRYLVQKNCPVSDISFKNLPIHFFVPEYDFFFSEYLGQLKGSYKCGHADLWKKAPLLILEKP